MNDAGGRGPGDCPACGASVGPGWQFCASCGEAVRTGGTAEPRQVTVVVSDLAGSTALAEGLDPETLRAVLDRYFDELGAVLESHGGLIEKRIGDMILTVFGLHRPAPDDAERALRAVIECQQTLEALNDQLHERWGVRLVNRTGVASGPVLYEAVGGSHRLLSGPAMEAASALEPLAPHLEALVDESTVAEAAGRATFGPEEVLETKDGQVMRAAVLESIEPAPEDATATDDDADGCASCGTAMAPDQRWCTACGLPLERRARSGDRRRYVTIVFVDLRIVGSAEEPLSSEDPAHRDLLVRAFDTVRDSLERHGGAVEKFIGDAVMAVFGLDRRHEDDALRAVRAALEAQDRLAGLADAHVGGDRHLEVRIGVNTGPVVAGDPTADQRLVTGDAVNVAARLEQTARPGAVVVGALTRRLLGPGASTLALEPLTLKGKSEPVPAYRVWSVDPDRTSERFELPLMGRDEELAALWRAWSAATEQRAWQRLELVGEPGIGKSRLVHELADQLAGSARVLRSACLSYGEGITFWPVAELVRQAAGIEHGSDPVRARLALDAVVPDPEVAERLSTLIGLDERIVPVTETSWAVRSLLDHLATAAPLLVVVDGTHWAEPTLLELLDDLVERGGEVPALLITMGRGSDEPDAGEPDADEPDADEQAADDDPDGDPTRLRLEPLDEATCAAMITSVLGTALPDRLRDHIVQTSAGVPLYVEQLLTTLVDDGRLVRGGDGWALTGDLTTLEVPPTLEAILASRIDALPEGERATVEAASVIGREFAGGAVVELSGRDDVGDALNSLRSRQLIATRPAPDTLADHRFRNLMIRDVAYDGLLKRVRSGLHLQYADWLTADPEALADVEEILGHHLEQSFLLGTEVGPVDDHLARVGERAADHLGAGGLRAFARGDMPAAAKLLGRAAAVVPRDGALAARFLVGAGEASFEEGELDTAMNRYQMAEARAADAGDPVGAAHARLAAATQGYLTDGGVGAEEARAIADETEGAFTAAGDQGGIARCWRLRSYVELTLCQWGAAELAAEATIRAARTAGDTVLERRVIPALAAFSVFGPTPVPAAIERCRRLLASIEDDRRAQALIERSLSHLLALDGEATTARTMCAAARDRLLELGWNFDAALMAIDLGPIELWSGRADAAEQELRRGYDALHAMGEQNYVATVAALLGEAVRRLGRADEALSLADESREVADEDDVATQAGWRGVRSRVLVTRGRTDEALDLAREALELVQATDDLGGQGEAQLDLAAARAAAGDHDGARAAANEAFEAFDRKAHRPGRAEAERLLRQL